ncbi:hypothetical protein DMA11_04830 [Marinilabiliaceae bacterium JC017]|nr:hypothetical protein DMA11_04830 [Marinilabiliaceae bacterium JC017]
MTGNRIENIKAALKLFDGCEFDIRMSEDRIPVLYHDASINGTLICETRFEDFRGLETLEQLLGDREIVDLVNQSGKKLVIEVKEDLFVHKDNSGQAAKSVAQIIEEVVNKSEINVENLFVISFCAPILRWFRGIRTLLIIPYINCSPKISCFNGEGKCRLTPKTIWMMCRSLKAHVKDAQNIGCSGLLFSNRFLKGFFSLFQPSLEQLLSVTDSGFILGTNAKDEKEEEAYKQLWVITDIKTAKVIEQRAGLLISHRGV